MSLQKKETRKFLGKTENFESKEEKRFNQRMLNAYLKGHKFFNYGFKKIGAKLMPVEHLVLQSK